MSVSTFFNVASFFVWSTSVTPTPPSAVHVGYADPPSVSGTDVDSARFREGGVRVTDVDTHIWDDSGEGGRVTDVDTHIWDDQAVHVCYADPPSVSGTDVDSARFREGGSA